MGTHKKVLLFGSMGAVLFVIGWQLVLSNSTVIAESVDSTQPPAESVPTLDTVAYDAKLNQLAHVEVVDSTDPTVTAPEVVGPTTEEAVETLWPAEAVYPNYGALLPFNRIVAYYGNFYSRGMGVLGEYLPDTVVEMLKGEVAKWEAADVTTPVIPAIDYIAVTAQASPGKDGMYRLRMPTSQIDKAVAMAAEVDGIVILEVQAGLADVMTEVRLLEPYLQLPQVHLAIDPEFAMVTSGRAPGTVVGTVDATLVNEAAAYLATLVQEHQLTPKILVIHRYTQAMVTNAEAITPLPEVQIVMDMDGWGSPGSKINTYQSFLFPEPVQFTGFKLFYYNDAARVGARLLTPEEILHLTPSPSFIQYQ